ncbi:hypothetical protein HGH92_31425 [Chitinophaga varians]|uniref:Uncharacterized protein n=1 Tax=Chitinophaga varians TaxID=2202339 RepID=A0A847S346_9BACT|nr:hypothetical protein [Chitinophaga varians]NLR68854.1 hypothetical protein [Chitinophaga varians]
MLSAFFIISIVLLLFWILRQLILVSTNILYLSKDDELAKAGDARDTA